MPTKNPRFTITMEKDLYDRIENYRYEHRMKSQTQAVISLVRSGIDILMKEKATPPDPEGPRDEQEEMFISLFSKLTEEHKKFLIAVMQVLLAQD